MGNAARFSTPEELDSMKRMVKEGMEAGCRGFSTGLTYFPGMYAHTDEIVELAKVANEYGGRYATHVRGHSGTYDLAVREALEIASRSGCRLQLSHVFAVPYLGCLADILYSMMGALEAVNRVVPLPGIPNPVLKNAVRQVDQAIEGGQEVGMDFIPYVMGNTTVTQLYPPWANIGGTDALLARLQDPAQRSRIRKDVETLKPRWPHWEEGSWSDNYIKAIGWKMLRILSVASEKNRSVEGKRVVDLAREAGKDPFDYLADLTVEENGMVTFLFGTPPRPWSEKVFTKVQDHPELSIGADVLFPEVGIPPQSAYGTFVRIIEHYVKELKFYTLEDAIHRSTGLSASRYGLEDRGVIKPGAAADLVVFDLEKTHDNSTYDDPEQYPDGIEYVIVNGRVVVENGAYDPEALAGQLLEQ
jgi:N-acyl-D-aspartate/D-glutamate deacylase